MSHGRYDTKEMRKTKSVRKKLKLAEEQLCVAEDGISDAQEYLDYWQKRVSDLKHGMWDRARARLLKQYGRKHGAKRRS